MNRIIPCIFIFLSFNLMAANVKDHHCSQWGKWLERACTRYYQITEEGTFDLYFSGYAWHNRFTYRHDKIKSFNEEAWGGGLGKGFYDEKGNWHGLYSIAFLDSHRHIEPVVGYSYLKILPVNTHLKGGFGYTVLVTSRVDINNGIPFPGVLPWISIIYKNTALGATYIPGAAGAGNVLYVLAKFSF